MLKNLILILVLVLNLSAFSSVPEKIYLISHAGAGDPFWSTEFKGAQKAAQEAGVQLQIVAPERAGDLARQVELLNAALATNPQGIALSVPDDHAFSQSLLKAQRQGIPVVAFNTRPSHGQEKKNPFAAFIGMDEYKAGVMAGQKALSTGALTNAKRVVIAIHQPGHIGLEQRAKGIIESLQQVNKNKMTIDKLDITSDASEAQLIFKGYLKKHPETAALFCLGPQGLHPLAKLLQGEKRKIFLASFDMDPLTLKLIKSGQVNFTIDQQPYMQGYLSVIQLALASRTKVTPSSIDTGGGIIDQKNVETVANLVQKGVR